MTEVFQVSAAHSYDIRDRASRDPADNIIQQSDRSPTSRVRSQLLRLIIGSVRVGLMPLEQQRTGIIPTVDGGLLA